MVGQLYDIYRRSPDCNASWFRDRGSAEQQGFLSSVLWLYCVFYLSTLARCWIVLLRIRLYSHQQLDRHAAVQEKEVRQYQDPVNLDTSFNHKLSPLS